MLPLPFASSACNGITFAPGATPVTPAPLFWIAAMTPLTKVPWPFWSCVGVPWTPLKKLCPATVCPVRSGAVGSTPVSTTATVTPAPVEWRQADVAPMSSPGVPLVPRTDWPVFDSPH